MKEILMATEKETKELLVVAFSAYATHKSYSPEEWLAVQAAKRNGGALESRYRALVKRA